MDSLLAIIQDAKKRKLVIGATCGCFDLLHDGHLYLLREARKHCDSLFLLLNNDASIKRLKGVSRPVDTLAVRQAKLMKTGLANCIIPFELETEMLNYLKDIRPNVFIKGSDYHGLSITGAGFIQSYGGRIMLIPLLEGFSTTKLLQPKS